MTTTRFLHTSDLQLGMTRAFLDEDAAPRFEQDRLESVRELGKLAQREGCEFIVMAGDIFEWNSLKPRTRLRTGDALAMLPVDCYLLPGNHDPLNADSILRRICDEDGAEKLHLLADSEPVEVSEGVEIVGAPLMTKHATHDVAGAAAEGLEPTEKIRILAGHGATTDYGESGKLDLIDTAVLEDRIGKGALDYVALGDTHSAQPVGKTGKIWYSGAPEVTAFREQDGGGEFNSGKALVVDVEKTGLESSVTVTEHQIGKWRFEAWARDIAGDDGIAAFLADLEAVPDKERRVIKYALTGAVSATARRELEAGVAQLEPKFGALYERDRTSDLVTVPSTDELADLGLTGFAATALEELLDAGEQDAVNLLFRFAQSVKEN